MDELPGYAKTGRDPRYRDSGPLEIAPEQYGRTNLIIEIGRGIRPRGLDWDAVLVNPTHIFAASYTACLSTITKPFCVYSPVVTLMDFSKSFSVNHLCSSIEISEVSTWKFGAL